MICRIRLVALLAGLLAVAAAGASATPQQNLTPLPDRPAAPGLELADLDGTIHRLADYRGRVVILNFWATWCPPCREEMPAMQRAWELGRDQGVVLLAVNVGESVDQVWAFTADYPVTFPLLLDGDGTTIEQWPVKGLPTTFVIDPEGRLVYRAIGGREWDAPELLERIRALLRHPE